MTLEQFLAASQQLLVITGAGCSTGSGIEDYRDDEGAWKRTPPIQHQDFMGSRAWRQRYWARSQRGYPIFLEAQPNAAHLILARWEANARLCGLITQNVDGLHQRAGHRDVIDLHGRLDRVACMDCGAQIPRALLQDGLDTLNPQVQSSAFSVAPDGDAALLDFDYEQINLPTCDRCGGDCLKPTVVFYGDSVAREVVDACYARVATADALLIIGSSLMVYSSFRFVRRAHELGLPIAAINRGKTRADSWLSVKVSADCGSVLNTLGSRMEP